MDLVADLTCDFRSEDVFPFVDDLGKYPQWMGLVHRAVATDPIGEVPEWDVELRARVGPFARSKRLTMARVECVPAQRVVFERHERDGRQHSMWRLVAKLEPTGSGCRLEMGLHYGGGLWTGGIVERVLHDEITRSRTRLVSAVADSKR